MGYEGGLDLQTPSGRHLQFETLGTNEDQQGCCERCCPCCLVICPGCCSGAAYRGGEEVGSDEGNGAAGQKANGSCWGILFFPFIAIATLLTEIFVFVSQKLYAEAQDFKNTHRWTRHFSLESCLIVFVVAATTRRDLVAMMYLSIALFILCARRRTLARFWMHFVQAPLFTISILQYLFYLGII